MAQDFISVFTISILAFVPVVLAIVSKKLIAIVLASLLVKLSIFTWPVGPLFWLAAFVPALLGLRHRRRAGVGVADAGGPPILPQVSRLSIQYDPIGEKFRQRRSEAPARRSPDSDQGS